MPFRRLPLNNPVNHSAKPPEVTIAHEPTPKECAEVKQLLGKVTGFPVELVDIVMNFAEYWACSVAAIDYSVTQTGQLSVSSGNASHHPDRFIVSYPL